MATSLIAVTALGVASVVGGYILNISYAAPSGQGCRSYMQPAKFEIWEATTNNRAAATKIAETVLPVYTRAGLTTTTARYVWVRAIDPSGNEGVWFPGSASGGYVVSATTAPIQGDLDAIKLDYNTKITNETNSRVTADSALATRTSSLEASATNPSTGFAALSSRISTEESARVSADSALANRTSTLESSVNNGTTGLAATRARLLIEETTRADQFGSLSSKTTEVEALANGNSANGRIQFLANAGPTSAATNFQLMVRSVSGGVAAGAGMEISRVGTNYEMRFQAGRFKFLDAGGSPISVFDQNGLLLPGRLSAGVIDTKALFVNGVPVVATGSVEANAITDMAVFTGNGEQGILASGNFTVTTGRVVIIAAGFLDRPTSGAEVTGYIRYSLKYNGIEMKSYRAFYDDNFAFGVSVVHGQNINPGTYNFTFHADNESGLAYWKMLPGSTFAIMNLKR